MGKPYKVCPDCGTHLDVGERCDCKSTLENDNRNGGFQHDERKEVQGDFS